MTIDLRTFAGQEGSCQHVISHTMGNLGNHIGSCRGDYESVRLLGKSNMLNLEFKIPVKCIDYAAVASERLKGNRRNKVCSMLGHKHMDLGLGFDQHAGQAGAFICCNSSGNAQEDRFSF